MFPGKNICTGNIYKCFKHYSLNVHFETFSNPKDKIKWGLKRFFKKRSILRQSLRVGKIEGRQNPSNINRHGTAAHELLRNTTKDPSHSI